MPIVTTVPGVYIEEDASPAISVSQGATAVPLFIGRFKPNIKNDGGIVRISSWLDFSQKFSTESYLYANVEIISTVVSNVCTYEIKKTDIINNATSTALRLYFQNGGNACYIFALEDATNGDLLTSLPGKIDSIGDITLILAPDNDETYRQAVYGAVAASLEQNKGYFLLADSPDGKPVTGMSSSAHAAAYYPALRCSGSVPEIADENVSISGFEIAKSVTAKSKSKSNTKDEPAITAVISLVELEKTNPGLAQEVSDRVRQNSASLLNIVQPSALMAGIYCKTDLTRGVWKAPANVVLNGVSDVNERVSDDGQGEMNQNGINVIRYFSDRGIVVWGARTTLLDDDNWRYIPVRRLFDAAQRDIKKAIRPMVFEPNNPVTWKRVKSAVENYLYRLWQQGGLAGNKADEAFFVRIGKDITMTTDEINQGKMIVQIGMAAVRPAEFIILQFTQDMAQ